MRIRSRSLVAQLVLGAAAIVAAHDLLFLVRFGSAYGEALAHAGHDGTWTRAVAGVGLATAVVACAGLGRLARLTIAARRARSIGSVAAFEPASFARGWLQGAIGLALAIAVTLTIQENLERASVGLPAPGLGLLVSPEYPGGLPIVAAVAAVVALAISLFRWRHAVLVARIRSLRPVPHRTPRAIPPVQPVLPPTASPLARGRGLRAPPALAR